MKAEELVSVGWFKHRAVTLSKWAPLTVLQVNRIHTWAVVLLSDDNEPD